MEYSLNREQEVELDDVDSLESSMSHWIDSCSAYSSAEHERQITVAAVLRRLLRSLSASISTVVPVEFSIIGSIEKCSAISASAWTVSGETDSVSWQVEIPEIPLELLVTKWLASRPNQYVSSADAIRAVLSEIADSSFKGVANCGVIELRPVRMRHSILNSKLTREDKSGATSLRYQLRLGVCLGGIEFPIDFRFSEVEALRKIEVASRQIPVAENRSSIRKMQLAGKVLVPVSVNQQSEFLKPHSGQLYCLEQPYLVVGKERFRCPLEWTSNEHGEVSLRISRIE